MRYNSALKNLLQITPRKFDALQKRLGEAARLTRLSEAGRSDGMRAFWISRTFVQRVGQLTGLEDDAFFMEHDEIINSQIEGSSGSARTVEGSVRIFNSAQEGDQLQPGEILVAITTNVGWTPIFPRAAAVITDVGAPLSHAAIVARELGIPAVAGCFNASSVLKTGDLVRVDGGQGIVEIIERAA